MKKLVAAMLIVLMVVQCVSLAEGIDLDGQAYVIVDSLENEVRETTDELTFDDAPLSDGDREDDSAFEEPDEEDVSSEQQEAGEEGAAEETGDAAAPENEALAQPSEGEEAADAVETDESAAESAEANEAAEEAPRGGEESPAEQLEEAVPTEMTLDLDDLYETVESEAAYASSGIAINEKNFPDPVFRQYIKDNFDGITYGDTTKNNVLSSAEIARATGVFVSNRGITKLTGIKYFTELKYLTCNGNKLTELDVSGLTKLESLACDENSLTELNVSGCKALKSLRCQENQLSTLDVSGFTALQTLNCYTNRLSSLKLDKCSSLTGLSCGDNELKTLDVSACKKLKELYFSKNDISTLNINGCTELTSFNCSNNPLTTLDLSNRSKLESFSCYDTKLTELNLSNCSALTLLHCYSLQLNKLNASGCSSLESLNCSENQLTSLNVDGCKKLTRLDCMKNQLKTLNISDCVDLIGIVDKDHYNYSQYSNWVSYDNGSDSKPWWYLYCDCDVQITGGNPVAPVARYNPDAETYTSAPTSDPVPVTPTINAVKKSSKTTLVAAPGTVAQLDLGGAVGKKFKSSKKKVATVDQSGLVTIKKAGKTKITFKVGRKTRKVILTVKDPTIPKAITLNLAGTQPAQVGVPQTLAVTLPEGTTSGIKWTSSNKKVATVSNGVVTFKKKGKVTITAIAKRGKKKAKVKFKVSK